MVECSLTKMNQKNDTVIYVALLIDGEEKEFLFDITYAKIGEITAPVIQERSDFYKIFWDKGAVRDKIKLLLKENLQGKQIEFPVNIM